MVKLGLCCQNLKDAKVLMKTGLGLVLAGHVNFLLGALVQGTVLRDVKVNTQTATLEYAISNIIALAAGLMAVIGGISAIILSKNMKNQPLKWALLVLSGFACLLGAAAAVSVLTSMVMAIQNSGTTLLTQCKLNNTVNTYSVTHECPFDPTRIYGTTLILWALLVLMSVVEVLFATHCFMASISLLRLSCSCRRKTVKPRVRIRTPVTSIPSSPVYPQDDGEPAEQHDLLHKASPTNEISSWL